MGRAKSWIAREFGIGLSTVKRYIKRYDDRVLACAVGGNADAIVSGDQNLLQLAIYENIRIFGATRFLEYLVGAA